MFHAFGDTHGFTVTDALVGFVTFFFKEELIIGRDIGDRLYLRPRKCGLCILFAVQRTITQG